jgi:hypothetical protein
MSGTCSMHAKTISEKKNLKGRDHLETQHRCKDNIKMGSKETGCDGVDWI